MWSTTHACCDPPRQAHLRGRVVVDSKGVCVQERNALKRSKPQSDAPHPETPGVKGARADLTRVSAAGQIRRGQLEIGNFAENVRAPSPSRTPWLPTA